MNFIFLLLTVKLIRKHLSLYKILLKKQAESADIFAVTACFFFSRVKCTKNGTKFSPRYFLASRSMAI